MNARFGLFVFRASLECRGERGMDAPYAATGPFSSTK